MTSAPVNVADILAKLPPVCAHVLQPENKPIYIKRGESGYYPAPRLEWSANNPMEEFEEDFTTQAIVDRWNGARGITKRQVECMFIGSMCGWDVPGADVDYRDEVRTNASA